MKNSLRLKETDSTKHSKLLLLIIFPLLCYKFMFGFSIISIEISMEYEGKKYKRFFPHF